MTKLTGMGELYDAGSGSSASVPSGSASEVEDGGAGEPVVGEVAQGRVGLLERVRGGRHPDGDLRRDGQELLAVVAACWP